MKNIDIPTRKFVDGEKKMVSWRIPEALMKELEKIAKMKGYNVTELVVTVLDQYIQQEKQKK